MGSESTNSYPGGESKTADVGRKTEAAESEPRAAQDGGEEQNRWHALPGLIGGHIVADDPQPSHSGGYMVDRDENGDILIYRVLEMAPTEDELGAEGDRVQEWYDYYTANEQVGAISAPEDGWAVEVDEVRESIWEGY